MVKNLSPIQGAIVDQLFHGKNFEWNYLLWILLVFACNSFSVIAQRNYARKWEGKDLVKHELDYRMSGLIKYADEELSQPDPAKIKYVNWSNLHNYFENVAGYRGVEYANLYQHDPFLNRDEWIHAGNIGLLVRLAQQPKSCLSEAEQEQAAMLIKRGLLKKHEGGLIPTIPMIETAQWRHVNELILEAIHPCIDEAVEQVTTLADSMLLPEVRKDLWEHYVNWIMVLCLSPLNYVLYQGREEGLLQLPEEYDQATHGLYLRLY